MQKEFLAEYNKKYPAQSGKEELSGTEKFVTPKGYSDSVDHFRNFFASVRTRQEPVEDAVFGYRAAGAALLSNLSVERGQVVNWNPDEMNCLKDRDQRSGRPGFAVVQLWEL